MSEIEAKKFFNKALEYYKQKKFNLVEENFEKALELFPDRESILKNLASIYFLNGKYKKTELTIDKFEKLGFKDKELDELKFNVLKKLKKYNELFIFLKDKNNFKDINKKIYVNSKLLYPFFFKNNEEVESSRAKLEKNIDEIYNEDNISLTLESEMIDPPIFNSSYDQYENLELNRKIVKTFRKIYPTLNQNFLSEKKNEKIKIGFISEFFSNHTIGKLFKGLIFNLDQKKFDPIVFHSKKDDHSPIFQEFVRAEIDSKIKNIILPKGFQNRVDKIKRENLDIVFFPDIGMSTEFYYLSFIRFAKVQVTSWGHPITTSNNSIDYFLTSKLLETSDAEKRFSEKLLFSKYLPMYFYKPVIENVLEDTDLIVKNKYFCSQNLIKLHPHFDEILAKIAKKDKSASILLIKDNDEVISQNLIERFKNNSSLDSDKIKFLDKMDVGKYINLCGNSSVLLDTIYFGAGNSFHESMFYGTPTVTMPTKNLKSRIVLGAYKQMQIENPPVVDSIEDYVECAVELANNEKNEMLNLKKYYQKQASDHLFENKGFIKDINIILENISQMND